MAHRDLTSTSIDSSRSLSFQSSDALHQRAFRTALRKIAGVTFVAGLLFTAVALVHASNAPADQSNTAKSVNSVNAATPLINDSADTDSGSTPQTSVSSSVSQQVKNGQAAEPVVTVTVNGQDVPVSANSGTQTVTDNANGTTTVNLQTSNGGSNSNTTFTNLNVSSNSYGSTDSSSSTQTMMNGVPVR